MICCHIFFLWSLRLITIAPHFYSPPFQPTPKFSMGRSFKKFSLETHLQLSVKWIEADPLLIFTGYVLHMTMDQKCTYPK